VYAPGEVISYLEMCREEGISLQRGMNFRLGGGDSVVLMSRRPGAPYTDRVEEEGRVLIYEGHDVARRVGEPDPKTVDQPLTTPGGRPTQNALFFSAAKKYANSGADPERVRVYEKLRQGIWVFNGVFRLVDAWEEPSDGRGVFKFHLELDAQAVASSARERPVDLEPTRVIPTAVKLAVWRRDGGCCVQCGSRDNLHFDHVIPYSRGGSSLRAENIQLLCARHNLQKHDAIV
jgi:HNH endonuclease